MFFIQIQTSKTNNINNEQSSNTQIMQHEEYNQQECKKGKNKPVGLSILNIRLIKWHVTRIYWHVMYVNMTQTLSVRLKKTLEKKKTEKKNIKTN